MTVRRREVTIVAVLDDEARVRLGDTLVDVAQAVRAALADLGFGVGPLDVRGRDLP